MRLIGLIAFLLVFQWSNAQSSKLISQLEIGAVRGIQLSKTFPILKSGAIANLKVSKELSPFVQIGAGLGYITLENENFTPIYAYFKGVKKKTSNSYFFEMAIGKSIQLVCGAAITTYFFISWGKSLIILQPKRRNNIKLENAFIVYFKVLNLRT